MRWVNLTAGETIAALDLPLCAGLRRNSNCPLGTLAGDNRQVREKEEGNRNPRRPAGGSNRAPTREYSFEASMLTAGILVDAVADARSWVGCLVVTGRDQRMRRGLLSRNAWMFSTAWVK